MREKDIQAEVLLESPKLGCRLFRNQVGKYQLKDGRFISSGLAVGSPDLVGWAQVTITPEMVGRTVAVFLGAEIKTPVGRLSFDQRLFLNNLHHMGGIAVTCRSVDDLSRAIMRYVDEHSQ